MEYKWKALSVVSVGVLMAAVDSTIVMLALLPMAEELHTDYITMIWVVIGYLLINTALVLSLGRLADIYGRKRMYNIGFIIFTVGSALCGCATTGVTLIVYRLVQGVGASLLTANSFAILSEAFPNNEKGKAFGMNSIVWGAGSVLGIILGGLIISYTSWRLIFLINIPIGICGTIWAYKSLRESRQKNAVSSSELKPLSVGKDRKPSFDVPAALAFTAALLCLQMGVTWGLLHSWVSSFTITFFALTPFCLLFFVIWEIRYSQDPIIDLSLFTHNRAFAGSIITSLLQSLALFSANFLLIFYFEGIYGLPVLKASYLLIPMAVSNAIVGPFAGRLADKIGTRLVVSVGLAIQVIVMIFLSQLSVSTSLWLVAVAEMFLGVGAGLFWPANTSAIMSSVPKDISGAVSGVMNTFRNTGMILSFAVSLTAATSAIPANIVNRLFMGNFEGTLSPSYAIGYLNGQRFAFEVSAILLAGAILFSAIGMTLEERNLNINRFLPRKRND